MILQALTRRDAWQRRWQGAGARITDANALLIVGGFYLVFAVGALPLLLLEGYRDWWTFARSADALAAGASLYFADGDIVNLYPPAMAMLWRLPGMGPLIWFGLGLVALLPMARLAPGAAGVVFVGLTALLSAVHYDLLLGNVMTMYLGATAWFLVTRGWLGALPLGVLIAVAAKPAFVPFVLFMLVRRRADTLRVIGVAATVTAAAVVFVGLGPHLEYVRALAAAPSALAEWTTGNVGLGRVGLIAVAGGVAIGIVATVAATRWCRFGHGVTVALAAGALVQPTLGMHYAALPAPGVALLWREDRLAAVLAALALPAGVAWTPVVSSILVGAVVIASALASRRRSAEARGGWVGSTPRESAQARVVTQ